MANSTYGPQRGFAQSEYNDQQATALAGQQYSASDQVLVDSAIVAHDVGDSGLEAGLAVIAVPVPAAQRTGMREGANIYYVNLPAADTTGAQIFGVSYRNQQMDTNGDGHACWFGGRTCNVMRSNRVGGRLWVQLTSGTSTVGGAVHVIKSNTTNHGKPIGSFAAAEITGDTIVFPGAVFRSNTDASVNARVALVELAVEV